MRIKIGTDEEIMGINAGGHAAAFAALKMLVTLGHKDFLQEVRDAAIYDLEQSLSKATLVDQAEAIEHGRNVIAWIFAEMSGS